MTQRPELDTTVAGDADQPSADDAPGAADDIDLTAGPPSGAPRVREPGRDRAGRATASPARGPEPTHPPTAEEVAIECPGCGLTVVGDAPRGSAAWFCPTCDYPLFWAEESAPSDTQARGPGSHAARRRLPGSGGRLVLGAEPCWHCGEMVAPGGTECHRCAATVPKPMAPVIEVERIVEVPVAVPTPVQLPWWPYAVAAALGAAAVGSAVGLWLGG